MYSSQLAHLVFGLMLGWGAAIPIGPMNLEIIRRNLKYGSLYGVALGIGACTADVTYIILLALGALTILHYAIVLKIVGILGSLVLAWFGYSALKLNSNKLDQQPNRLTSPQNTALWLHTRDGYILTLINPYTILFWSSVSSQIAVMSQNSHLPLFYASVGVLIATLSWVISLNIVLNFTKHRLSSKTMQLFNYFGGVLLLLFAVLGLWHSLYPLHTG